MIAAAAHELRNPLSPVYMQVEYLKEVLRSTTHEISRPWLLCQLDAMTSRFDHFLDTLNRLLDISRIAEGGVTIDPEECDLVEVVTAIAAANQRELQAAGCALEIQAPAKLVGWWDRLRLEQIIGNLLSNAIRYGAGCPITVCVESSGGTAQLVVRDHGIGIAREDQARIFRRFERARNVGSSPGFGVGLWVVAELCRAMGGGVTVDSELGKGAAFTVRLPRRRQ
jgi:signal transduction histidine kinase